MADYHDLDFLAREVEQAEHSALDAFLRAYEQEDPAKVAQELESFHALMDAKENNLRSYRQVARSLC